MTWKQWMVQGIITVILSAVAAIGGMRVGLATAHQQILTLQIDQVALSVSMNHRLDRLEDKMDRLIERRP